MRVALVEPVERRLTILARPQVGGDQSFLKKELRSAFSARLERGDSMHANHQDIIFGWSDHTTFEVQLGRFLDAGVDSVHKQHFGVAGTKMN